MRDKMFRILSTASALPRRRVRNEELAEFLDTSDEWIRQRTGIRERAVCTDESLTDLMTQAGREALERAGVKPQELDLILCATIRGDDISPSQACLVQRELGAGCPAVDLGAACTGFLYALDVAAGYFARGRVKRVLILAGDTMSRLVNWKDRSTCVLFGDGAGAVLLGPGEALRAIRLTADGNSELLKIPHSGGNSPFDRLEPQQPYLSMNGQEVYKFAVSSLCRDVRQVCSEAGVLPEELDWLVPHQANLRIIESAAHKLHIPMERCLTGIETMGNTSAASIPIVLDRANTNHQLQAGQTLALTAFGAGLTTGACILTW